MPGDLRGLLLPLCGRCQALGRIYWDAVPRPALNRAYLPHPPKTFFRIVNRCSQCAEVSSAIETERHGVKRERTQQIAPHSLFNLCNRANSGVDPLNTDAGG